MDMYTKLGQMGSDGVPCRYSSLQVGGLSRYPIPEILGNGALEGTPKHGQRVEHLSMNPFKMKYITRIGSIKIFATLVDPKMTVD